MDSLDTAKRIVAGIVQMAGGEIEGKTKIAKAYYVAHLFHFRDEHGLLSRKHRVVRLPYGPGIDGLNLILADLVRDGVLEATDTSSGPWPTVRYKILRFDYPGLTEAQARSIERGVRWVSERTASDLSELTHQFSRSWIEGKNGDDLDIYLDLIPEDEEQRLIAIQESQEEMLRGIFG